LLDDTCKKEGGVSIPFSAGQRLKVARGQRWRWKKNKEFLSLFQQGKDLKFKEVKKEEVGDFKKFLSLFQQGKDLKF